MEEVQTIAKHILEIIEFHDKTLHKLYLGFQSMFVPVLISGETEREAKAIMAHIMEWLEKTHGPCGYIGFKTVPDIAMLDHFPDPNGDIATTPFKRVGSPDFYLNKAD